MGVEADSWETDSTLPVSEVVALIVGQLAEGVERHAGVVSDDEILGWSDSTNGYLVRDQKELEVVGHNILVDHRSWLWVVLGVQEESVVDSLVDKDLSELGLVAFTISVGESGVDGWDLGLGDEVGLRLTYTVSVEDNHFWESAVLVVVSVKSITNEVTHNLDKLLTLVWLNVGLGVEGSEVGVHGGTETDNRVLVVSGVVEDIGTDEHGVLWDAGWGLGLPEDLSGLGEDLESDVVHDGHVHLWSLVSVVAASSLTTSASSTGRWVLNDNGVVLDNGVQNTELWKRVLLDISIILAALVIDEEHDELNIRIILFDLANFFHDILGEGLGVDPLPDWLIDLDSEVVGGLGELVDELVDGVVAFLVLLSKGCVDTSPIIEFNILLIDLFDLEETIFDIDSLATGGNDLRCGQLDGFNGG